MKTQTSIIFLLLLIITNSFLQSQTLAPPTIDWQSVSYMDEDINGNPSTQNDSGEEWWYEHKNIYVSGIHTGYVTVGYSSLVSKGNGPADLNTYNDVVNYYNEGTNSYYNPIVATDYDYNNVTPNGDCTDRDYAGEHRTPVRGTVALNDLNGNMIWCKAFTSGEMQGVVQAGNYIYVIGSHFGTRPLNNHSAFLTYNPTLSNPTNDFSILSVGLSPMSIPSSDVKRRIYVAKLDLSGNILWEHIYGGIDYATNKELALKSEAYPYDIIVSSNNNLIIAGNITDITGAASEGKSFVFEVETTNGFLINKNILPNNTILLNGSSGIQCNGAGGKAICEIGTTQTYAYAAEVIFYQPNANPALTIFEYQAAVYKLNSSLIPTQNPTRFYGQKSNVWDITYHTALNKILLPLVDNCAFCANAGINNATGNIYKLDPNTLSVIGPAISMGPITAYDLRVGVCETADGGFAAVSSNSPVAYPLPTASELAGLTSCVGFNSDSHQVFDTDALVCKFSSSGTLQWKKVFDVKQTPPIRPRASFPGDIKRQECLYKISQAQDGGYVISGNTSFNFDDNYLVKIKNDCQTLASYDYKPTTELPNQPFGPYTSAFNPNVALQVSGNVVWNSSKKIKGVIVINNNSSLTINGVNTVIEFADSNYVGFGSGIYINNGGKLYVNNATLTSFQGCGNNSMWQGIVLNSAILSPQNLALQPYVNLNGAKIVNSRHGVITAQPNNSGSGGGIVQAVNTTFKNNYIDVEMMPYYYTSNNTATDLSYFFNSRFLSDAPLNDPSYVGNQGQHISTAIHVKLNGGLRGVKFTGCTFKTDLSGSLSTLNVLNRGLGIRSYYSTFSVDDYCVLSSPSGCAALSGNAKFENLSSGISVSSSNVVQNYAVQHSTFNNCLNGIYQNAVNYSKVQFNTFNNPTPFTLPSPIKCGAITPPITVIPNCVARQQYYLNQCDGFKHANNQYNAATGVNMLGTIFNHCSGTANYSYRNGYSAMLRGQQLQAGNSNLQLKCNTNANTQAYDVSVTSGVVSQQGLCTGPTAPANNLFSHAGTTESDMKSVTLFQYNYKGNPSAGFQIPLYTSAIITNQQCNPVPVGAFNYTNDCPVEQNPGCGAGCRLANINNINGAISQNNALLLAGSAASLITLINTQSPGQVKNALLAKSPYLSDVVLLTYLGTNPPNGHLKNVVQANQPLTDTVWQAVQAAGLPNGIYNQLAAGQSGTSARTALQQATQQLVFNRQNEINQAVIDVLNPADSLINYSQAESFMKLDNSGAYYDDLAQLYLITGQLSNAQSYIDSLALKPQNSQLVQFLNLAVIAATDGNWQKLLQNPINNKFIYQLALNTTNPASGLAQSIADYYITPGLYNTIEDFGPNNGNRLFAGSQNINSNSNSSINFNKNYTVYPNPFTNELRINYNIAENDMVTLQLIEIGSGKLIADKVLPTNESTITLNSENIINGIYLISFIKKGEAPVYYKLVNIK